MLEHKVAGRENVMVPSDITLGSYDLSAPPMLYGRTTRRFITILSLAALSFLLGGISIAIRSGGLTLIVIGFDFLGMGVWIVLQAFATRNHQVLVSHEGLVETRRGKTTVIPWESITTTTVAVTPKETLTIGDSLVCLALFIMAGFLVLKPGKDTSRYEYAITIRTATGIKRRFGRSWTNVERLGATIAAEVSRRLLPAAIARIDSGDTVSFGRWSVSYQGIKKGGRNKIIAWAELESAWTEGGYLVLWQVSKRRRWASERLAKIPNPSLFLTLVDIYKRASF